MLALNGGRSGQRRGCEKNDCEKPAKERANGLLGNSRRTRTRRPRRRFPKSRKPTARRRQQAVNNKMQSSQKVFLWYPSTVYCSCTGVCIRTSTSQTGVYDRPVSQQDRALWIGTCTDRQGSTGTCGIGTFAQDTGPVA